MGLIDGGGASSTLQTGGAVSTGSIGLFRVTKNMYIVEGFRVLKISGVSGTPKLYEVGIGFTLK
jgi:alkyl sulfatase BDS1-like metallo-beta-lactamase superfamily hydrolase